MNDGTQLNEYMYLVGPIARNTPLFFLTCRMVMRAPRGWHPQSVRTGPSGGIDTRALGSHDPAQGLSRGRRSES